MTLYSDLSSDSIILHLSLFADLFNYYSLSLGSWISSLLAIGAIVGAPLTGFLVEKFGRKMTNLMLGFPFLASWALIVFTNSVTWLYIARILGGIATGGACVATPMYVSEISEVSQEMN